MKKGWILAVVTGVLLALTACSGAASSLPDLSGMGEIKAVAREEGSGTRAEFESLVSTSEAGAGFIAMSTNQVMEEVAKDTGAIGYIASSAVEPSSQVKVLRVGSKAATSANIADGSYPLCRQYLLAYKKELTDVETDFITYILGAGQEIVAAYATGVHTVTTFLSNQASGTIKINGSSSVAPLIEELAADYARYNSHVRIEVTVTDSTEGINAALRGDCDLAMSSRSLKDYEAELLATKAIASDAVVLIVNTKNPLEELTLSQIRSIYDGQVRNWSDLR